MGFPFEVDEAPWARAEQFRHSKAAKAAEKAAAKAGKVKAKEAVKVKRKAEKAAAKAAKAEAKAALPRTKGQGKEAGTAPIELFTNGMCPFSHRAHFAAALSGANIKLTYIPLSGQVSAAENVGVDKMPVNEPFKGMTAQQVKDLKARYITETNPSGEVPTIKSPKGDFIYESEICAEYLNSMSKHANLVPEDPVLAARMRLACKKFNDVIPACFQLLKNQDPAADQEKADDIKKKLAAFASVIDKEARYCFGSKLTLADVHVGPFLFRFRALLLHYRGFDIFEDQELGERLKSLADNIQEHVAFQKLIPVTPEQIISGYRGMANGFKWVQKPEGDAADKWFNGRGKADFGK